MTICVFDGFGSYAAVEVKVGRWDRQRCGGEAVNTCVVRKWVQHRKEGTDGNGLYPLACVVMEKG